MLRKLTGLLPNSAPQAEEYYHAIQISERLYGQNSGSVAIGDELASMLNSLGALLHDGGRGGSVRYYSPRPEIVGTERELIEEAEKCYRRAIEIYEALHALYPQHIETIRGLALTLSNLGLLLNDLGRAGEGESHLRRAVQTFDSLVDFQSPNVNTGYVLAAALNNLGTLLERTGRRAEGKRFSQRALQIYEALFAQDPNVAVGDRLAMALANQHVEPSYRRAIQVYETLYAQHPEDVAIGTNYASVLNNLRILLVDSGRAAEAQSYRLRRDQIRKSLAARSSL